MKIYKHYILSLVCCLATLGGCLDVENARLAAQLTKETSRANYNANVVYDVVHNNKSDTETDNLCADNERLLLENEKLKQQSFFLEKELMEIKNQFDQEKQKNERNGEAEKENRTQIKGLEKKCTDIITSINKTGIPKIYIIKAVTLDEAIDQIQKIGEYFSRDFLTIKNYNFTAPANLDYTIQNEDLKNFVEKVKNELDEKNKKIQTLTNDVDNLKNEINNLNNNSKQSSDDKIKKINDLSKDKDLLDSIIADAKTQNSNSQIDRNNIRDSIKTVYIERNKLSEQENEAKDIIRNKLTKKIDPKNPLKDHIKGLINEFDNSLNNNNNKNNDKIKDLNKTITDLNQKNTALENLIKNSIDKLNNLNALNYLDIKNFALAFNKGDNNNQPKIDNFEELFGDNKGLQKDINKIRILLGQVNNDSTEYNSNLFAKIDGVITKYKNDLNESNNKIKDLNNQINSGNNNKTNELKEKDQKIINLETLLKNLLAKVNNILGAGKLGYNTQPLKLNNVNPNGYKIDNEEFLTSIVEKDLEKTYAKLKLITLLNSTSSNKEEFCKKVEDLIDNYDKVLKENNQLKSDQNKKENELKQEKDKLQNLFTAIDNSGLFNPQNLMNQDVNTYIAAFSGKTGEEINGLKNVLKLINVVKNIGDVAEILKKATNEIDKLSKDFSDEKNKNSHLLNDNNNKNNTQIIDFNKKINDLNKKNKDLEDLITSSIVKLNNLNALNYLDIKNFALAFNKGDNNNQPKIDNFEELFVNNKGLMLDISKIKNVLNIIQTNANPAGYNSNLFAKIESVITKYQKDLNESNNKIKDLNTLINNGNNKNVNELSEKNQKITNLENLLKNLFTKINNILGAGKLGYNTQPLKLNNVNPNGYKIDNEEFLTSTVEKDLEKTYAKLKLITLLNSTSSNKEEFCKKVEDLIDNYDKVLKENNQLKSDQNKKENELKQEKDKLQNLFVAIDKSGLFDLQKPMSNDVVNTYIAAFNGKAGEEINGLKNVLKLINVVKNTGNLAEILKSATNEINDLKNKVSQMTNLEKNNADQIKQIKDLNNEKDKLVVEKDNLVRKHKEVQDRIKELIKSVNDNLIGTNGLGYADLLLYNEGANSITNINVINNGGIISKELMAIIKEIDLNIIKPKNSQKSGFKGNFAQKIETLISAYKEMKAESDVETNSLDPKTKQVYQNISKKDLYELLQDSASWLSGTLSYIMNKETAFAKNNLSDNFTKIKTNLKKNYLSHGSHNLTLLNTKINNLITHLNGNKGELLDLTAPNRNK